MTTIKSFQQRKAVITEWKKSFSLMGLVKYINKSTKDSEVSKFCALFNILPKNVTIDMLKTGGNEEKFFTHNKAGERTGDKVIFQIGFAMDCIKGYYEKSL